MIEVKGKPWAYKGSIDVRDCKTSKEVMIKAGLDFEVIKGDIKAEIPLFEVARYIDDNYYEFSHGKNAYCKINNNFCTYRSDTGTPLSVVGSKYTIVQNIDAFKFFDDCIGMDRAIWDRAGFWGNGEKIFVSAKLPNTTFVNGDPVDNYLVFTNTHDGTSGVKILFTPIRVVCENTLTAAIKSSNNYVSFRHTESVKDNISEAYKILGICDTIAESTKNAYQILADTKVSEADVMEYICKQILNETEQETFAKVNGDYKSLCFDLGSTAFDMELSSKKRNLIPAIYTYYHTGIGQDAIKGTAWGAFNAITGYWSNCQTNEGIKRLDTLLYGGDSRKIKTAINDLLT